MELKMCLTPLTCIAATRACSATPRVSARVLPGGSSILIWVCARSDGGTKPVGNNGTSAIELIKKIAEPSTVRTRWFRHQRIAPR